MAAAERVIVLDHGGGDRRGRAARGRARRAVLEALSGQVTARSTLRARRPTMRIRRRDFLKATGGGAAAAAVLRGQGVGPGQADQDRLHAVGHRPLFRWERGSRRAPVRSVARAGQRQGRPRREGRGPTPHRVRHHRRSQRDRTAVRFYEKLMGDDKVDLICPLGHGHELRGGARRQQVRLSDDRPHVSSQAQGAVLPVLLRHLASSPTPAWAPSRAFSRS